MGRTIKKIVSCLVPILVLSQSLLAQPARLPTKTRLLILFNALTYDAKLKTRGEDGVRIGVVSIAGNSLSQSVGKETTAEISLHQDRTVKGLPISVEHLQIGSLEEISRSIKEKNLNILYLTPGLDSILAEIVILANRSKLLLITGEAEYLNQGVALGAVLRGEKPKILVNLDAASAQGAQLDARLLRLAEIVK